MSCLDLLRQQAYDLRAESNAAAQKQKKSLQRVAATTVVEGWELLSQLKDVEENARTAEVLDTVQRYTTILSHGWCQHARVNQVQTPAEHQFTGTKSSLTPSSANAGGNSSVFDTPTATPVGVRSQNQYAWGSMRSQRFAAGTSCVQQNNVYVARPQLQAGDASDFFSLSEQELDEVLASLGNSNRTGQQKTSTTEVDLSADVGHVALYIPPPGAGVMGHSTGAASAYGPVMNAAQAHGNAPMPTTGVPATGAQVIHISVPAGAEVLEIRESSAHPGAYEVMTFAGTFMAYGLSPAVNKQPQRQPQDHQFAS